jgi:hypothetical protein
MSLDFYLEGDEIEEECACSCCNNIHMRNYRPLLFVRNITHNLGKMADAAGIYNCLWRPHENGFKYSKDIISILQNGLNDLMSNPIKFRKFEANNGWGTWEGLVSFVSDVLHACKENPNATIEVSR